MIQLLKRLSLMGLELLLLLHESFLKVLALLLAVIQPLIQLLNLGLLLLKLLFISEFFFELAEFLLELRLGLLLL